ncbi:MAG: hypothetical protein ABL970_06800 [Nitrospira sp.]
MKLSNRKHHRPEPLCMGLPQQAGQTQRRTDDEENEKGLEG